MQSKQSRAPDFIHPIKTKNSVTLIPDQQGILSRWAEHLVTFLVA